MHLSIPLLYISLLYLLLIFFIYVSKEKNSTTETKLYLYVLINAIVSVVLDIAGIYANLNLDATSITRWLIVNSYFVSLMIFLSLVNFYIMYVANEKKILNGQKNYMTNKTNIIAYVIMNLIVVVVSFILPFEYYNNGNVIYVYGANVDFLYIMVGLIIVNWLINIILNKKDIKKQKIIPMVIFILLLVPTILIQNLIPELLLITSLSGFLVVFMYHTIENPDVKMINQLKLANTQVEKANRAKTDFLSSMSHEIRTPLNAIIGFSECIKEEDNLETIQADASDIIVASETLLEIVNGILDISKIEANKMEIVNTEYDLVSNLENIAKLIYPRIADKPIEFHYNVAEDIPSKLYGDIGKIKQIITNLLTNAAKYTNEGHIIFNVSSINQNNTSSLVISVKDTGRGISEAQQKNLFTKFQRLDEDKNTTTEGTGLGLAITKALVEILGGKIIVKSKYTEGSEFIVYLNQQIVSLEPKIKSEIITQEEGIITFDKYKILVVDDNSLNLKVASRLLKKYGINPSLANSGFECLELTKTNTYDLILLDDMMPKLSGKETFVELTKNPEFITPVVALTANAITGMRRQYLDLGFNDYLSKPIDKTALMEVLKKYYKHEIKVVKEVKKKKVLIVDDNKTNIKVTTRFLEKLDVEIDSVTSGIECLNKIENNEYFDLILMDDMMPELSGVETYLKSKEKYDYKLPVIVLTANAIEGAREHYLSKGFTDYISKPINLDKFLTTIKTLLNVEYKESQIIEEGIEDNHTKQYLLKNNVDLEYSLNLLGDMSMYDDTIKDFIEVSTSRKNMILDYKDTDMKNYAIQVHALKSDCKYLGFLNLAQIAYDHELKSKDNDNEFVLNNFETLITEFDKVIYIAKTYISNN